MSVISVYHPREDDLGRKVRLYWPSRSGPRAAWSDPDALATVSLTDPCHNLPDSLYGTAFTPWPGAPTELAGWEAIDDCFTLPAGEPDYPLEYGLRLTSGCVVIEPDDRVWLVHPSNAIGGIRATFPKGRLEPDLSLLTNAVKETFEESGLWAWPLTYLCDVVRTHTVTRYYTARRVGGTPLAAGWESQAVSLAPPDLLPSLLSSRNDHKVLPPLYRWLARRGA